MPEKIINNSITLKKFSLDDFYVFAPLILQPYFLETPFQPTDYTPTKSKYSQAAPLLWNKWAYEKIGKTLSYCVFDTQTNDFLGTIEIQINPNPTERTVEITGFGMPTHRGSIRSKQVFDLISQKLFDIAQVTTIRARVSYKNNRCINFLKKCGFNEMTSLEETTKEKIFDLTATVQTHDQ